MSSRWLGGCATSEFLVVLELGTNKVVDLQEGLKSHLLWLQNFNFVVNWNWTILLYAQDKAKNLWNKKYFETLHVPLQRDRDGQSEQYSDHHQDSRVNHLRQSWSYMSYSIHSTTTFILIYCHTWSSQSYACFSNGSLIWEKLKQGLGSLIVKPRECTSKLDMLKGIIIASAFKAFHHDPLISEIICCDLIPPNVGPHWRETDTSGSSPLQKGSWVRHWSTL